MIKLFNDTDTPWRVSKPHQNGTVKISAGKTVDGVFRGTSIVAPHENLDITAFNTTKSTKMVTPFEGNTSIYYGKFDNLPNIGTQGANKNIYFIAKDFRGKTIVDITRQDVFIFSYYTNKGRLYLIMSVKDTCKEFSITLWDKETQKNEVTTFNLETDTVNTTVDTETSEQPEEQFKIRRFRPSRPTTAILIREDDEELVDKKLLESEAHVIYRYKADGSNMGEVVATMVENGYSAATLFTGLEDVMNDDFGDYDDTVTYMRSAFAQLNIILGRRPDQRIIKR